MGDHLGGGAEMTKSLPAYIEFRRDRMTRTWRWVCRACGVTCDLTGFWDASRGAFDHADMHAAEEDPPVTSAGDPG